MQGIMVAPSGDVWIVGLEKNQLVQFPKGDWTKGKLLCEGDSAEPCKSFKLPFDLGIDQQDRIWVSNAGSDHVTRFLAADPSKAGNNSSPATAAAGLASTVKATSGSRITLAAGCAAWPSSLR